MMVRKKQMTVSDVIMNWGKTNGWLIWNDKKPSSYYWTYLHNLHLRLVMDHLHEDEVLDHLHDGLLHRDGRLRLRGRIRRHHLH